MSTFLHALVRLERSPMPVSTKVPQPVFTPDSDSSQNDIYAFPPNRETLGGTAYLICEQYTEGKSANILIDCPALSEAHRDFIAAHGGVSTLFITHRGGMAQVPEFQKALDCDVLVQEQEAYLMPTVRNESFHRHHTLSPSSRVFWTPGHSPGSACLYHAGHGGILFTGRHLLPTREGKPAPLRLSKTFHWPRQLRYSQQLLADFDADTLSYICPGASTGFLRGEKKISEAYSKLQSIDWAALKTAEPGL